MSGRPPRGKRAPASVESHDCDNAARDALRRITGAPEVPAPPIPPECLRLPLKPPRRAPTDAQGGGA